MADNLDIKDVNGVAAKMRTTEAGGIHTAHHIAEGPSLGAPADAAASTDSASTGLIGLIKRLLGKFPAALSSGGGLKMSDVDSIALDSFVNGSITDTTGNNVQVSPAQGTNITTYLTDFTVQNMHATDGVLVEIKNGTTVKWRVYCDAKGGGGTHRFEIPLPGDANAAWNIDAASATTTIIASFSGYKV